MKPADVEVWVNTAAGMRWYKALDVRGQEVSKVVQGGRTFTLTILERQLNQEIVDPSVDMFRDGTFVLRKPSENTDTEEVRSPNSFTHEEIDELVREIVHGDIGPAAIVADITSVVALDRVYEALVVEGADKAVTDVVKQRKAELSPEPEAKPQSEPVYTVPDDELESLPETTLAPSEA